MDFWCSCGACACQAVFYVFFLFLPGLPPTIVFCTSFSGSLSSLTQIRGRICGRHFFPFHTHGVRLRFDRENSSAFFFHRRLVSNRTYTIFVQEKVPLGGGSCSRYRRWQSRGFIHFYGKHINQNRIWRVNIGEYKAFGSIVGSDYYI